MRESLFQEACQRLRRSMKKLSIPGVALGILYQGKDFTAGFGITNTEEPQPYSEATFGQIGSISKTVTATAAMRLVETGKLELDRPVRDYLPGLRLADADVAARVTLRHLFIHTAGWLGDYFEDTGPGDDALEKIVQNMEKLPQVAPLGEIWSYNNAAFYLAGRVLEVVAGKPFEVLAHQLVLEPLGMQQSCYFANEIITYRVSAGHAAVFGPPRTPQVLRPWSMARSGNAIGGLNCTLLDLLRYARFHMSDGRAESGERLLSPETLRLMQTPQVAAANGEWLGIAWFLRDLHGVRILRHGGWTNGQMATLVLVPGRQFALAILANSDRGSDLYVPLTNWALQAYLGLQMPKARRLHAGAGRLQPYVGRYVGAAADYLLELFDEELYLIHLPKGGFPDVNSPPSEAVPERRVDLYAPDGLIVVDEPGKGSLGEFLRGADGSIEWFRFGGRVHHRLKV